MANLSASEITKAGREYRAEIIIKKMNEGTVFELSTGKKVKFTKSKQVIDILKKKTKSSAELNALRFVGSDGKQYKLSDIKKNAEFGGKGDRSSVAKEDAALEAINSQLNAIKKSTKLAYVPIKIKSKIHKVVKAESTPGTPKSDFHLINEKGEECVWISHKDGKSAKDFQQWGGISERKEPLIFNHKETQKFIADLKAVYPKGLPSATTLYRHIKDTHLKMLSVYGNSYGGTLGQQNVSILLQGPPTISKSGSSYVLGAVNVHYNGDSVDGEGFDPVLMAIYKGDRSDAGVKGTRIVISPVGGRKGSEFK
jgi:hypothetical protein